MTEEKNPEVLPEVERELQMGSRGIVRPRVIPLIDLTDFSERRESITEALWDAAANYGFFQLTNHGIPIPQIDSAFLKSKEFFALPESEKAMLPLQPGTNSGWEYMAQVRPSTGVQDHKESFQITTSRMGKLWPELKNFKTEMLSFERSNWELGMQVLSCFASRLGFENDFFTNAHDPHVNSYQSTLRLLHYMAIKKDKAPNTVWRAGPHTDFDCLTLLHQEPGQSGLQICPGVEMSSLAWTDIEPSKGVITCNIGDMLARWSDDELRSTLHRVVFPEDKEKQGSRFSIAFFCQANTDIVIRSPRGTYESITAGDYLKQRVNANAL